MTAETNLTVSFLIALVGCFVGLAGYLAGRDKKISNDAEWRGQINAKLDFLTGIKPVFEEVQQQHSERITKVEASTKQAHYRIDRLERLGGHKHDDE